MGLDRSQRLGMRLSVSGALGPSARFGLSWRGEKELSEDGLRQAFAGELRAGFPKTPLEAILHGEWSDAGSRSADGLEPAVPWALPGGRASLELGWRLRDRTRLAALVEALAPAAGGLTVGRAAGLRFGLSWGTRESD